MCAGSVDTRRTEDRVVASATDREQDVVVFPTPPLPPTKIHFRVSLLTRFLIELSSAADMLLVGWCVWEGTGEDDVMTGGGMPYEETGGQRFLIWQEMMEDGRKKQGRSLSFFSSFFFFFENIN